MSSPTERSLRLIIMYLRKQHAESGRPEVRYLLDLAEEELGAPS